VVHEPELLGTAGGVANAASKLGAGEALVWNADVIADIDVPGLFAVRAQSGALAALCAAPRPMGQGTLGIDADGRVARLRGHRFGEEVRGGDFLGIQVIGEALRAELPHEGCLVGDVYLPALRRGADLRVLDVHGAWDDIGSVAAYLQANLRWLAARGAPAHIGDGAQLASGVELEASVVGAAAVVDGQGALRRCVVWPGARATAPLEDAVITRAGHVVRG
jgi:mannose-1-phosphate guanylyltransferase